MGSMETRDYLKILKNEIHTTVMATVDQEGCPVARVIDVMLVDDTTLYFITAKGKEFYRQLMEQQFVAISGACGGEGMDKKEASIHMKAISIRGKVQNIGEEKLEEVFLKNPYMNQIYPNPASRKALEVFCVTEGTGEFFDLSTKPITRASFIVGRQDENPDSSEGLTASYGSHCSNDSEGPEHAGITVNAKAEKNGYFITDACVGCRKCTTVCPQACIDTECMPFQIRQEHCLHCGNCLNICPSGAVRRK